MPRLLAGLIVLVAGVAVAADPLKPDADGFVPLFDGKSLTGWVNVNCDKDTFAAKDGEIVTTGKPTGFLRTDRQYENFILEMDWMHANTKEVGNSGLFVWGDPLPAVGTGYTRGIEVQVLVNLNVKDTYTSHGDLFSIWGAKCTPDRPHPKGWERCLPSEERCMGGGEWNHYKVTANDGVIKLEVNGKEVSGVSECNPRKGYLALESEGAECHFKNLRIKELPSTKPKASEVAKVDGGHLSLFDGLTLDGWKAEDRAWKATDGVLRCKGKTPLATAQKYDRFELLFDWKLPAKSDAKFGVSFGDKQGYSFTNEDASKLGKWNRLTFTVDGTGVTTTIGEFPASKAGQIPDAAPITFAAADGLEIRNLFLKPLPEKKK